MHVYIYKLPSKQRLYLDQRDGIGIMDYFICMEPWFNPPQCKAPEYYCILPRRPRTSSKQLLWLQAQQGLAVVHSGVLTLNCPADRISRIGFQAIRTLRVPVLPHPQNSLLYFKDLTLILQEIFPYLLIETLIFSYKMNLYNSQHFPSVITKYPH